MRVPLLALLSLLPAAATPDILPPGHKDVRHELILVWGDDVIDHRFAASPTRGFHGNHEIRAGEPFAFSSKYGTRIFAVPPTAALPDARDRLKDVPWPNAAVPVREVRSIASGHPLARVETTLRVTRVTVDGIEFARVGERRLDARGNELGDLDWLPLALIAAGGAFWTWRQSRAEPPPAAEPA